MVIPAQSIGAVADRAGRFFARDNPRIAELNDEVLTRLSEVGTVFVVGGLIRDLAFYGASERPTSDIDFVVTGRTKELDRLALRLGAIPNRFGGFGLKRGGYKIDFWSLRNTWASVHKHSPVWAPKDLIRTTFFDWDGIIYNINNGQIHALPRYIDRLHSRVVEINLESSPSIKGNLVRALRRLIMWDARPGAKLQRFIDKHLHAFGWDEILLAEKGAFDVHYLHQFRSGMDFKSRGLAKRSYNLIGIDSRRQISFHF